MVITKVTFTDAEIAELERIDAIVIENTPPWSVPKTGPELEQSAIDYDRAMEKRKAIVEAANARYIAAIKGNYELIISDTAEVLEAFTGADYIQVIAPIREAITRHIQSETGRAQRLKDAGELENQAKAESVIEYETQWIKDYCSYTYHSAKNRLLSLTANQLKAIEDGGHPRDEYDALISDKAASLYSPGEAEQPPAADTVLTPEQLNGQLSLFSSDNQAQDLPLLSSIYAPLHIMPNSPLMNALQQKPAINYGPFDLPVARAKGHRKEITAYTIIEYDPADTGLQFPGGKLSEYERQVSDAIVSLWTEADKRGIPPAFTTDAIFRAMPGGGDKPSPQQRGAITRTIQKFRSLHITYNPTEYLRRRGVIGPNEEWVIDDNYLYARRVMRRIKNGGQTVYAYLILAEPVMLTYAKLANQLISIDRKFIEIEKVSDGQPKGELVAMNPDRQSMTGYMLRRIAVMKKDLDNAKDKLRSYNKKRQKDQTLEEKPLAAFREQSPIILFATLFSETGTETTNRDRAMDNRNFCFQVLDYWKATGYIKGYQRQTKGRAITGIEIDL